MKYLYFLLAFCCVLFFPGCDMTNYANYTKGVIRVERNEQGYVIDGAGAESAVETGQSDPAVVNVKPTGSESIVENSTSQVKEEAPVAYSKITVKNAVTNRPIPGVPLIAPQTNVIRYADKDGVIMIEPKYREAYIPKISGYSGSGNFSVGPTQQNRDVLLRPEGVSANGVVKYIYGEYSISANGGAQIVGKVVKDGKPVPGIVIAVNQSSLTTKTDSNGAFKLQAVNESAGYRLYFPEEKNSNYYQVDVFKGHVVDVNIEL